MADALDAKRRFWESFLRAAEVEPREVNSIRGSSGLSHPVLAAGVDQGRRRLLMISGEADGRSAALAQADIQAAMPDVRVVMARPAPINLGAAAKIIGELLGSLKVTAPMLATLKEAEKDPDTAAFEKAGKFTFKPFEYAALSAVAGWKEAIQQLALVEIENSGDATKPEGWALSLERLAVLDPSEYDRRMGVCTIPLYEISAEEAEQFQSGVDTEAVRDILRRHDILQYFFPPADQLSLGLVDRSPQSLDSLIQTISTAPSLGHPFGTLELLKGDFGLKQTIESLQSKGLVVEGEFGLEITAAGSTVRSVVRYKPREGVLSKLANIISLKVDLTLKDLFKF